MRQAASSDVIQSRVAAWSAAARSSAPPSYDPDDDRYEFNIHGATYDARHNAAMPLEPKSCQPERGSLDCAAVKSCHNAAVQQTDAASVIRRDGMVVPPVNDGGLEDLPMALRALPAWFVRILPIAILVLAIAGGPLLVMEIRTARGAISELIHGLRAESSNVQPSELSVAMITPSPTRAPLPRI